jgi:hypothetical protein
MLHYVALVRTDVSGELIASTITSYGFYLFRSVLKSLFIANSVPTALILFNLIMEAITSFETSVLKSYTLSHPKRRHSSKHQQEMKVHEEKTRSHFFQE